MSEESAFLAAIRATPDDDLPRLVYADWLDENDRNERAKFIRVQIELSRWGVEPRAYGNWYVDCRNRNGNPGTETECKAPPVNGSKELCEYHTLRKQQKELFKAHKHEWFNLSCEQGDASTHWEVLCEDTHAGSRITPLAIVRRGFVDEIRCNREIWFGLCPNCQRAPRRADNPCQLCHGGEMCSSGPELVAAHPITSVRVVDARPIRFTQRLRETGIRKGLDFMFQWYGLAELWPQPEHRVPRVVARLMAQSLPRGHSKHFASQQTTNVYFETEDEAVNCMNAASLEWAKLPPGERW